MAEKKTPPKQPELLLGAVALLGAAAALVALGAAPAVRQSAVPQQPIATEIFAPPQTTAIFTADTMASAAQPQAPAASGAIGYTGIVIYYTDAAGEIVAVGTPLPDGSGEVVASIAPIPTTTPPPAQQYPVNLNTATQAQLETLPGIGEVKAQAILAWRAAHGGFANVSQLLEISGIGEKTLQNLLPYITL